MTIPSINNANFAETLGSLSDGLKAHGLQILLGYTDYDLHEEERLIEQLLRRRPAAIVVTGGRHTDRARRLPAHAGVPVIETWDRPAQPIGHVVGFSNAAAVRGMVDHFAARGRTRIAFLGDDGSRDARGADRRAGFIAAMEAQGLEAGRLIGAGGPPISMREGAEAMGPLLDRMPDTEAVICVSDLSAFGALSACQRRGVAVPGRISIAGFGDFEIGAIGVPSLTTINPFPREIGSKVADLIMRVREGRQAGAEMIDIRPELRLRESTV